MHAHNQQQTFNTLASQSANQHLVHAVAEQRQDAIRGGRIQSMMGLGHRPQRQAKTIEQAVTEAFHRHRNETPAAVLVSRLSASPMISYSNDA
jgi:hypothetical protein